MKQLFTLAGIICCMAVFGQNDVAFKESSFQFGKIRQNVPVTHVFQFTNTGSKPLVIEFANAECGCTTPEYANTPVLKGRSGTIKVTYNAANMGAFKKKVNIKFVNTQLPVVLTIEGEVMEAKAKA